MANRKTTKKKQKERLKRLKELYAIEPGNLTPSEIKELKDAGMI